MLFQQVRPSDWRTPPSSPLSLTPRPRPPAATTQSLQILSGWVRRPPDTVLVAELELASVYEGVDLAEDTWLVLRVHDDAPGGPAAAAEEGYFSEDAARVLARFVEPAQRSALAQLVYPPQPPEEAFFAASEQDAASDSGLGAFGAGGRPSSLGFGYGGPPPRRAGGMPVSWSNPTVLGPGGPGAADWLGEDLSGHGGGAAAARAAAAGAASGSLPSSLLQWEPSAISSAAQRHSAGGALPHRSLGHHQHLPPPPPPPVLPHTSAEPQAKSARGVTASQFLGFPAHLSPLETGRGASDFGAGAARTVSPPLTIFTGGVHGGRRRAPRRAASLGARDHLDALFGAAGGICVSSRSGAAVGAGGAAGSSVFAVLAQATATASSPAASFTEPQPHPPCQAPSDVPVSRRRRSRSLDSPRRTSDATVATAPPCAARGPPFIVQPPSPAAAAARQHDGSLHSPLKTGGSFSAWTQQQPQHSGAVAPTSAGSIKDGPSAWHFIATAGSGSSGSLLGACGEATLRVRDNPLHEEGAASAGAAAGGGSSSRGRTPSASGGSTDRSVDADRRSDMPFSPRSFEEFESSSANLGRSTATEPLSAGSSLPAIGEELPSAPGGGSAKAAASLGAARCKLDGAGSSSAESAYDRFVFVAPPGRVPSPAGSGDGAEALLAPFAAGVPSPATLVFANDHDGASAPPPAPLLDQHRNGAKPLPALPVAMDAAAADTAAPPPTPIFFQQRSGNRVAPAAEPPASSDPPAGHRASADCMQKAQRLDTGASADSSTNVPSWNPTLGVAGAFRPALTSGSGTPARGSIPSRECTPGPEPRKQEVTPHPALFLPASHVPCSCVIVLTFSSPSSPPQRRNRGSKTRRASTVWTSHAAQKLRRGRTVASGGQIAMALVHRSFAVSERVRPAAQALIYCVSVVHVRPCEAAAVAILPSLWVATDLPWQVAADEHTPLRAAQALLPIMLGAVHLSYDTTSAALRAGFFWVMALFRFCG